MWLLCLEFANNLLIFAVLERWLLQLRETDPSFVFIIKINSLSELLMQVPAGQPQVTVVSQQQQQPVATYLPRMCL